MFCKVWRFLKLCFLKMCVSSQFWYPHHLCFLIINVFPLNVVCHNLLFCQHFSSQFVFYPKFCFITVCMSSQFVLDHNLFFLQFVFCSNNCCVTISVLTQLVIFSSQFVVCYYFSFIFMPIVLNPYTP